MSQMNSDIACPCQEHRSKLIGVQSCKVTGESAEPGIKESVGGVCVCVRERERERERECACRCAEVGKELKSGGQVVTENQKTG